jgi:hypothetical protein
MYQEVVDGLVIKTQSAKWKAMAVANALKNGKFRKPFEIIEAMKGDTVQPYYFVSEENVYCNVYVDNLTGFKDERLAGILLQMEFLNPNETRCEEYAELLRKEFSYIFYLPADEHGIIVRLRIEVQAQIKEESETCRRVVIGMKNAEATPIYKIVCDEEVTK